jgi:hypothetical protein
MFFALELPSLTLRQGEVALTDCGLEVPPFGLSTANQTRVVMALPEVFSCDNVAWYETVAASKDMFWTCGRISTHG